MPTNNETETEPIDTERIAEYLQRNRSRVTPPEDELELEDLISDQDLKHLKFRQAVITLSRELFVVGMRDSCDTNYRKMADNSIEAAKAWVEQVRDTL